MGTKSHRARTGRALSEDNEAVQNVGVHVDESAGRVESTAGVTLDDAGFTEFTLAGTEVSGEFRCADCGYGAVVQRALPHCPMCGGSVWESRPLRFVD
jgi:rubrerythrin